MNCMKCGAEIEEDRVFCEKCVEVMKKYPVKPGIAIQLPRREEYNSAKKSAPRRRQAPGPEEKIRALKKRLRIMVVLWLVTLLLLAAAIYPTIQFIRTIYLPLPGQNYSTIDTEPTTQ